MHNMNFSTHLVGVNHLLHAQVHLQNNSCDGINRAAFYYQFEEIVKQMDLGGDNSNLQCDKDTTLFPTSHEECKNFLL